MLRRRPDTSNGFWHLRVASGDEEAPLRRHFSSYPDGLAGIGLLILRLALGTILEAEGIHYLTQPQGAGPREWMLAVSALFTGASFILGLYVTITASITVIYSVGVASLLVSVPRFSIFTTIPTLVCVLGTSIGLILLGAGAFSMDAKIFGRHEITIPKKGVR